MRATTYNVNVVQVSPDEYEAEVHGRYLSERKAVPIVTAIGRAVAQSFAGHASQEDLVAAFVAGTLAPDAPGRTIKRMLNSESEASHG